jgi:BlaI family penicillinase repressor
MARPPAKELTERELEIMQVFWRRGPLGVAEVQKDLAEAGLERAYTTVATLVRILSDKGFVEQSNEQRPFIYRPIKSYEEVSGKLLADLVERVFQGSRETLLVRLLQQKKLSPKERAALEEVLRRGAKQEPNA